MVFSDANIMAPILLVLSKKLLISMYQNSQTNWVKMALHGISHAPRQPPQCCSWTQYWQCSKGDGRSICTLRWLTALRGLGHLCTSGKAVGPEHFLVGHLMFLASSCWMFGWCKAFGAVELTSSGLIGLHYLVKCLLKAQLDELHCFVVTCVVGVASLLGLRHCLLHY